MSKLFFTKEEKLSVENNVLKENNLQLQIQALQNERQGLIVDFCKKNNRKPEEVLSVNLQEGSVEFKETEKKNKK